MNELILKARVHERTTTSYALFNDFSIDKGLLENYNAGQYTPNHSNQRVQSGGRVRNTLGAMRDAGSAAMSGQNPLDPANRAAAQRDRTGMTADQQTTMVGEQKAGQAAQAAASKKAGQDAARIKLQQNAPGVGTDGQAQTIENIQAGADPVAGAATGGPTTTFMDRFKTAGSNLLTSAGNAMAGPTEPTATEASATGGDGGAPVDAAPVADADGDGVADAAAAPAADATAAPAADADGDGVPDAAAAPAATTGTHTSSVTGTGTGTWANQAPVGGQSGGGGKVPGWRGAMDWGSKNPGKSLMLGGLPQIAGAIGGAAEWAGNKWFGQGQPKTAMEKMYLYNPELAAHLAYSSTMKSFREVDTTEAVRVAYR